MSLLLLLSIGILFISSGLTLISSGHPQKVHLFGAGGVVLSALVGIIPAIATLISGRAIELQMAWHVPFGSFHLGIDPLSSLFLIIIFLLAPLAALYAIPYMKESDPNRSLASHFAFISILIASMILVVTARNIILFIAAWEMMTLSSFFLVIHNKKNESIRVAGTIYLIASQIGAALLIAGFIIISHTAGSFDFTELAALKSAPFQLQLTIFILMGVGFGIKAGLIPLHVWLPLAHPAAPSHISALMSGVMIKLGIYGILRMLSFIELSPVFGHILIVLGILSGVWGLVLSLTQQEIKRILAYSSIENIGIIVIGLGLAILGVTHQSPLLAILGFAGAALHILNHSILKGLLFLCAGYLIHLDQEAKNINSLGGVLKKLPKFGGIFLLGSAALSGLPPLGCFISEFLLYLGSFNAIISSPRPLIYPSFFAILGLCLIGALASFRFVSLFGLIFLGAERSSSLKPPDHESLFFTFPLTILALFAALLSLFTPILLPYLVQMVYSLFVTISPYADGNSLFIPQQILWSITAFNCALILLVITLHLVRKKILAGRTVEKALTWDCGYIKPSNRMQYSSVSFIQPLIYFLTNLVRDRKKTPESLGYFPRSELSYSTLNRWDEFFLRSYALLFIPFDRLFALLRKFETGRMQAYILYIIVTLLLLFIWNIGVQE